MKGEEGKHESNLMPSRFQAEARFGESVQSAPDKTIDGYDSRGHHDGGGEK